MDKVRSHSPAGKQAVDKNLLGQELGRFEDGLPLARFFDRDGARDCQGQWVWNRALTVGVIRQGIAILRMSGLVAT